MSQWLRHWSYKVEAQKNEFCCTYQFILNLNQSNIVIDFNGGHHLFVRAYGILLVVVIHIFFTYIKKIG